MLAGDFGRMGQLACRASNLAELSNRHDSASSQIHVRALITDDELGRLLKLPAGWRVGGQGRPIERPGADVIAGHVIAEP